LTISQQERDDREIALSVAILDLALKTSKQQKPNFDLSNLPTITPQKIRTETLLDQFENQLDLIKKKAEEFEKKHQNTHKIIRLSFFTNHYNEASDKATQLANNLSNLLENYKKNDIDIDIFIKECISKIEASRPFLENYHCFKTIFINIVSVLLCGLPFVYNKIAFGNCFFNLSTNISNELTEVIKTVNLLNPKPTIEKNASDLLVTKPDLV